MAKRQRDYAAEHRARDAKAKAQGYASARAKTVARRTLRQSGLPPGNYSPQETRDLARFATQARRASPKLPPSFRIREDLFKDPTYLRTYHEMLAVGTNNPAPGYESDVMLRFWALQLGFDGLESWHDLRERYPA